MEDLNLTEEEKVYLDQINAENRKQFEEKYSDREFDVPTYSSPSTDSVPEEEASEIDAEIEEEEEEEFEARRDLNWVDNAMLGLRDSIDNNFQGDSQTREEIEESFIEKRGEREKQIQSNPIRQILAETTGAVEGASAQTIETLGETTELAIDTLRAVIPGQEDPKDIPWNENYEWADWDLGTAHAKTPVGKFAEQMIAVVIGMKGLKAAGVGIGGGQSATSRLASETFRGALYDFFSEPGEGNLSNLIQSGPLANPLSKALAHDEFDNPWIRKLKNMVEGGTIGMAVDGVQEAYGAIRAGLKATADAKAAGDKIADAARKGVEATRKYAYGEQPELDLGKPVKGKKKKISSKSASGNVYETTSQPIDYKPPEPKQGDLDLNIRVNKQGELDFGPDRPDLDPGNAARKAENVRNSGRPDGSKEALLDPQDRVQQTRKYNVNESVSSFWEGPLGSGKSLVNEADISRLKDIDQLKSFIKEQIPDIDVDYLTARLRRQPEEHVLQTFQSLAAFADSANPAILEPLRFKSNLDVKGVDAGGAVVLDTLVNSVSERISFLAEEASQLTKFDVPFKGHAKQIIDRAEALVTMKKEATRFSSDNLKTWGEVPPDMQRGLERDRKAITEMFDGLRKGLDATDPIEVRRFQRNFRKLSAALTHAKGDPLAINNIWAGLARVGWKKFESVHINSLLSSPLTHGRNLAGNTIAIGERTSSRIFGNLIGFNFHEARLGAAAFDSIFDSFQEAWAVGKKSFNSPYAIVTPGSKVVDFVAKERNTLVGLRRVAGDPGEKAALDVAIKAYDFFSQPWFNWPGKALQAGDDFTKTVLARMELRYEAAVEADKLVGPNASWLDKDKAYQHLASKKLSANGEVLDHNLIQVLDNASFQREMQGMAGSVSQAIQKLPAGRLILPFFRTGHNISRYGLQNSPLAPLSSEFRQVMFKGTADEKAIMLGRMATGSMITGTSAYLASQGLLTGFGPKPGPERDLWEQTHKPMSIWIGDPREYLKSPDERDYTKGKWWSYKPIPGLSIVMSTTADMMMLHNKLGDDNWAYLAQGLTFFVANAITDQPMFQGIGNMAEILDTRNWNEDFLGTFGLQQTNSIVGGSSLRRHIESTLSRNMHDFQTWQQDYLNTLTAGLAAPAMEALGLDSGKVMDMDILTGKDKPQMYSNPINSVNPFTVIGTHASPMMRDFAKLQYPINLAVPKKFRQVKLEPRELRLYKEAMYDNGGFGRDLAATLSNKDFQREYKQWVDGVEGRSDFDAPAREKSKWFDRLNQQVAAANERGRAALLKGDNPVSLNFLKTHPARLAKEVLSSGTAGTGLSFDVINNLNRDYSTYTQPTE